MIGNFLALLGMLSNNPVVVMGLIFLAITYINYLMFKMMMASVNKIDNRVTKLVNFLITNFRIKK